MAKLLKASDIKGDTPYDNILRAWLGHKIDSLPEQLSAMLSRWQDVDRLYKRGEIVTSVTDEGDLKPAIKRFNWRGIVDWLVERYGVSVRQAYDDIANAKRFFLCADGRIDVEYARGAAIEHGEMMMWQAFEKGDFYSAAQFFKELNKIKGLHEQTAEIPDYEGFEPPKFIITTDPTELGFEKVENPDEVVSRILNEKRKGLIDEAAEDAEVLE